MMEVQSPIIPVIGELIRRHPGTISLGQGVVYYGPPPQATERLNEAMADPLLHRYSAVDGLPPLIDLIEQKLRHENGIDMRGGARIVVTAGANMGFMNAVLAIADPGDEIILQTPYYFNHEMAVRLATCRPVLVPTDDRYQLQPRQIEQAITSRTRAVVTVSPNNPTGAVYPEPALRQVNDICRRRGIYHIHDEAYEYFTYCGARHFSPASIDRADGHTISLFSLSKAYGFASWRIGYMVIPETLLAAVKKVQDTILICPPVVSQYAAIGAMEEGSHYCRRHLECIADVRQIVLAELQQIEQICTVPAADGAFYFLLRIHSRMAAMQLVELLIREHGVATIPGETFGIDSGCCIRISYGALERQTAAEGIGRLVRGLRQIVGKD